MSCHKKFCTRSSSLSAIVLSFASVGIAAEQTPTKRDPYAVPRKSAMEIKATMEIKDGTVDLSISDTPLLSYKSMVEQWTKGSFWVWGSRGRPAAIPTDAKLSTRADSEDG